MKTNRLLIQEKLTQIINLPDGIIFQKQSLYNDVVVVKKGCRIELTFNPDSPDAQSRLNLDAPLYLVSPYTQAALIGLAWQDHPKKVHVIGLGGGLIPLVIHHYFPETLVECTEIDQVVVEAASTFFGLEFDAMFKVIIQDGRQYFAQMNKATKYDLIFVDAFEGNRSPYHLSIYEFYRLIKNHLTQNGAVIINLVEPNRDIFYKDKIATIKNVFRRIYIWPKLWGETVVIGTEMDLTKTEIHDRAKLLKVKYNFEFPFAERASEVILGEELEKYILQLGEVKLLTDNVPPINYPVR